MKYVNKKSIRKVESETKETISYIFNLIHVFIALGIIGLFSYWCYLVNDIYEKTEASDPEAVAISTAKANTIFHGIVLLFFIYFIFLARDSLRFIA